MISNNSIIYDIICIGSDNMEITIDVDELRQDLKDFYGSAMQYNPAAVMDLIKVEQASYNEIVRIAQDNHINLFDYEIKDRGRSR